VTAVAWPTLGAGALRVGGAWAAASTGGFFTAICAGLPSYWFYGVVADIRAPAWRLAVELVRVQAVGCVVLLGVLPFWLAGALCLQLAGADVYHLPAWMALTWALPFLAALPGMLGLRRTFQRMRGEPGWFAPTLLTAWWVVLFQFTGPVTIWSLFHALCG
ncbi:MAG TPA: hypothetical protein PKA64_18335, partial [Myxococcota bacterium]|nr:hypothetical protein [Myxococcota bacterium]